MSVKEDAAKRKVSEAPLRRWEKALNECLKSPLSPPPRETCTPQQ